MIVKSILDTDLYKFTTSYAYMKLFPHAIGTFEFFDRDNTEYTEEFVQQLRMEIVYFCSLHLTQEEQDYMTTHCRFIPPMYWEWLSGIKLSSGKVSIWLDEDKHLHITAKDYLYRVTLYEVPILAIVSELRNRMLNNTINMTDVLIRLEPKIVLSNQNQMHFSEFGTRRRYSYNVQEAIVKSLKDSATYCTGTSNCYLAMKYDMPMIGTHPHEWFMFHGAMYGYKQANYMALENWVEVYDGDLGIALSDTYTSAVFFKNLSRKQATDGLGISNSDLDQIGAKSYYDVDRVLQTLTCKASPENDKLQDELTTELGPDVVGKITGRRFKSRFKRLVSPIIVPREMYD